MDGRAVADQQILEGRRILITGANKGLGFETAKALAALGAEIILAVRDPAKGEAAASQIGRKTRIVMLDLAVLSSPFMAQSCARAALNPVFAATHDLPGGSYVGPDGPGERKGLPCLAARRRAASDPVATQRLWALSEEMTGVSFPL
nr:SDR family NAD(P)-dependent oxidoreductase [uncultured Cohaesibacter sp.]